MESTARNSEQQPTPLPDQPKEDIKDRIKLELGLVTEEYKALKAEIVQNLGSGRQVTALSLTALGLLVAGAKPLADAGAHTSMLLIPLVFYALAWSQLRYVAMAQEMGRHLRAELARKARELLREHPEGGAGARFDHVFKWEKEGRGPTRLYEGPRFWLFLPIAGANFSIPLLGAVFSLGLFLVSVWPTRAATPMEWVLLGLNALALVYSVAWGWVSEQNR
jgi:hypothetical protein